VIRLLAATAIVGGTVFTGEGPPLEGASVVIDGNRIVAVGVGVELPAGAERIDASGSIVTPGLIDAASRLGLQEVSGEVRTVEGTAGPEGDPIRAALRVDDTFNPASFLIPVARNGGLTSAAVVPRGGLVAGQSAWVDLVEDQPVRVAPLAVHVSLRGTGDKPGARSRGWLRLREAFEDARLFRGNRGPFIARRLRDLSLSARDLEVLAQTLERELPVVFEADGAVEIRAALRLIREYRLRAVLLGGVEAWLVADELARAEVPVLLDPRENLPSHFDRLRAREDNAALLHAAGVPVAITLRGASHLAHRLRHAAGNAVRAGLPYEAALAAITRVPADAFGRADAGRIAPGALANVAIWNGDPLELTTWPTRLLVRGRELPLRSRQDLLTERYLEAR
jgi:imidazolonepropionase-like amidohydrolase